MKVQIKVKLGEIVVNDNIDWDEFCNMTGWDPYCLNEGLDPNTDQELTLEQAKELGLI